MISTNYQRHANQKQNITSYLSDGYYQMNTKNKSFQGCGEKGNLYAFGGNVNWYSHMENYGGSSKNKK